MNIFADHEMAIAAVTYICAFVIFCDCDFVKIFDNTFENPTTLVSMIT